MDFIYWVEMQGDSHYVEESMEQPNITSDADYDEMERTTAFLKEWLVTHPMPSHFRYVEGQFTMEDGGSFCGYGNPWNEDRTGALTEQDCDDEVHESAEW